MTESAFDRAGRLIKEARAALDPAKVKAGDTAEIRSGDAVVRDVVTRTEFQPRGVILWFKKLPGGYWVDDADDEEPFRLTFHQPAAERRDLLADTIFEAVRDHPDSYSRGAEVAAAAVRAKFTVIDPAAARSAIVSALGEMTGLTTWTQGGGLTTRSCRLVLDRVTTALGIEVP